MLYFSEDDIVVLLVEASGFFVTNLRNTVSLREFTFSTAGRSGLLVLYDLYRNHTVNQNPSFLTFMIVKLQCHTGSLHTVNQFLLKNMRLFDYYHLSKKKVGMKVLQGHKSAFQAESRHIWLWTTTP